MASTPDTSALSHYSPEVLGLWGAADEAASEKWRQDKIADFEAGGKMKETHETREALDKWYALITTGARNYCEKSGSG